MTPSIENCLNVQIPCNCLARGYRSSGWAWEAHLLLVKMGCRWTSWLRKVRDLCNPRQDYSTGSLRGIKVEFALKAIECFVLFMITKPLSRNIMLVIQWISWIFHAPFLQSKQLYHSNHTHSEEQAGNSFLSSLPTAAFVQLALGDHSIPEFLWTDTDKHWANKQILRNSLKQFSHLLS